MQYNMSDMEKMSSSILRPITERSNAITANIDVTDPPGMVRLLNQSDSQIFTGWDTYDSLYSDGVVMTMVEVACLASDILRNPSEKTLIVMSGCGTSGRLAFLMARTFNTWLREKGVQRPLFKYIIAGGDRALFKSQEAPEDSYQAGIEALCDATVGMERVLFIGITCGFSAPFVAGQLSYCMSHLDVFVPVLLGFNPTTLARQTQMLPLNLTFSDVVQRLEQETRQKKAFILNPVLGPEAITGSTRMKSGSATKIILEVVFACAHHLCGQELTSNREVYKRYIHRCLQCYELVYRETYLHGDKIGTLVQFGGHSLLGSGGMGHICYLGGSSLAVMAMIDASECPPTFGSAFSDVRAFLWNSYKALDNSEGDMSHLGPDHCIGWDDFQKLVLPTLTADDTVVFILEGKYKEEVDSTEQLCKQLKSKSITTVLLCLPLGDGQDVSGMKRMHLNVEFDLEIRVGLPWSSLISLWPFQWDKLTAAIFAQLSVKLILNAMTTGAHIIKGKVLGNKMADLQVSNSKLYNRAIGIIQDFSGVDRKEAEKCLLRSIYNVDNVGESLLSNDVTLHVKKATGKEKVVPKALLLATGQISLLEAVQLLEQEPVVRKVLSRMHQSKSPSTKIA